MRVSFSNPNGADRPGDQTRDEDGLPIQEIREDLEGTTIGPAPTPSTSGQDDIVPSKKVDIEDEYWSEGAQARRAALRRKVFNEDSDSDLDAEIKAPKRLINLAPTSSSTTQPGGITSSFPFEQDVPALPPSPLLPSASNLPPTRSILKSAPRKKSVTFDESLPLPPLDSPGPSNRIQSGFPIPTRDPNVDGSDGTMPRLVPTIIEPSPPVRASNSRAFAGFKPGFLSSKSSSSTPASRKWVETGIFTASSNAKPKPSLLAQRRSAESEKQAPAGSSADNASVGDGSGSRLPRMSAVPQNSTVKTSVVEKPLPAASAASTSRSITRNGPPAPAPAKHTRAEQNDNEHEAEDEDADEDEEDDDNDEYDLDDALLAREVALDYHRRQRPVRHRYDDDDDEAMYDRYMRDDDDGDGDDHSAGGGESGENGDLGGVMMALPTVSNGKIVNPTPDELRKYVRVGRLENGNLVLAPGEQAWSDDEDAPEASEARRRRADVKRQLLGQEPAAASQEKSPEAQNTGHGRKTAGDMDTVPRDNMGMPPPVKPVSEAVVERQIDGPSARPAEPPRKVSRFKAARTGG